MQPCELHSSNVPTSAVVKAETIHKQTGSDQRKRATPERPIWLKSIFDDEYQAMVSQGAGFSGQEFDFDAFHDTAKSIFTRQLSQARESRKEINERLSVNRRSDNNNLNQYTKPKFCDLKEFPHARELVTAYTKKLRPYDPKNHINQLSKLYVSALKENQKYQDFFQEFDWDVSETPIKNIFRSMQKMMVADTTDSSCVKDVIRRQVWCRSEGQMRTRILDFLRHKKINVMDAKYRMDNLGDILFLFDLKDCVCVCEVQFLLDTTREEREKGHEVYEQDRVLQELQDYLKKEDEHEQHRTRATNTQRTFGSAQLLLLILMAFVAGFAAVQAPSWRCSATSCLNSASCVNDWPLGYHCICTPGWIGETCETETEQSKNFQKSLILLHETTAKLSLAFESQNPSLLMTKFDTKIVDLHKNLNALTFPNVEMWYPLEDELTLYRNSLWDLVCDTHVILTQYRSELISLGTSFKLIAIHLAADDIDGITKEFDLSLSDFEFTRSALEALVKDWAAFRVNIDTFGQKLKNAMRSLEKDINRDIDELGERKDELLKFQESITSFFWTFDALEKVIKTMDSDLQQRHDFRPVIGETYETLLSVSDLVRHCSSFLDTVLKNMRPLKDKFGRLRTNLYDLKNNVPSVNSLAIYDTLKVRLEELTERIQYQVSQLPFGEIQLTSLDPAPPRLLSRRSISTVPTPKYTSTWLMWCLSLLLILLCLYVMFLLCKTQKKKSS